LSRTARRPATLASLIAAIALLSGCILFPPFGPGGERQHVVENATDADFLVRFDSFDFWQTFAVPAGRTGLATIWDDAANVELLSPDCEPIDSTELPGSVDALVRIEDAGRISAVALAEAGDAPEPTRDLVETDACLSSGGIEPDFGETPPSADEIGSGSLVLSTYGEAITVLQLPGLELSQLAAGGVLVETAALSPDGSRVAVAGIDPSIIDSSAGALWLVDFDGGDAVQLAARGGTPDWSPDGERIAYSDMDPFRGGLAVIGVEGGNQRLIDPDGGESPAWSPDGATIAYLRPSAPSRGIDLPSYDIYLVDVDGGDPRLAVTDVGWGGRIAWAPDGGRFAYERYGERYSGVAIYDLASGEATDLELGPGDAAWPTYAPDGTLAVALAGRSTAIWLVDGDGQARELLDVGDAWIVDMFWSPDGRHLAYFASAPEGFTNALHVTTRAGEARRIATGLAEIVGWRE
jgi:dipeptidyl aminopeptidase/acylaminoacyl peptidase